MNLYQIDKEILGCIDVESGEIFDMEKFESLSMSRERKIENICLWVKNLKAESEALKAERDVFAQRQKATEKKMHSLMKYISNYLAGSSFESTKVKVSFRKSEYIDISEGVVIPDEFLRFKEPEVDKIALKQALKQGHQFDGVHLVENMNIQIR